MKRIAAIALAFTLVACSGATHRTAAPKVTAPPVSTSTAVDPTVIPPVITVDYLNAVLARLNGVQGDAFRVVVATDQLPGPVTDRIRALYNDPLYTRELRVLSEELGQGFANARKPPGDRVMKVLRILSAGNTCVWMQTHTDYSAATTTPQDDAGSEYLALQAKQPGIDPGYLNITPWAFEATATFTSPTPPPPDPCG